MLNAAKLKALREEKGWSQVALGKAMGQDGAYIRKLETGWTPNPGCQTLARLALALEVTADALLDFEAAARGLDRQPVSPGLLTPLEASRPSSKGERLASTSSGDRADANERT